MDQPPVALLPPLSSDSCFQTRRTGLTRSGLCLLSFTMLVLHPTSSCDICYDTYGQENPASTIPCGHIFCYRYVSPHRHRCDTRHFRLSVFPRVLPPIDVFPCADRACARCAERSSRVPMSRNLGRPTLGMVEPRRLFAVRFRQRRARQVVSSNDGIL